MLTSISRSKGVLTFPRPPCRNLGIDDIYFQLESVETIAQHILALYGAKITAYIKNEKSLEINLERITEDRAVFIATSQPGVSVVDGPHHEKTQVYPFNINLVNVNDYFFRISILHLVSTPSF